MTNSQDTAGTAPTSGDAQQGEAQPALVLVNLGTPTAPEPGPVRAFLREQDREIAEKGGRPPLEIKTIERVGAKKK